MSCRIEICHDNGDKEVHEVSYDSLSNQEFVLYVENKFISWARHDYEVEDDIVTPPSSPVPGSVAPAIATVHYTNPMSLESPLYGQHSMPPPAPVVNVPPVYTIKKKPVKKPVAKRALKPVPSSYVFKCLTEDCNNKCPKKGVYCNPTHYGGDACYSQCLEVGCTRKVGPAVCEDVNVCKGIQRLKDRGYQYCEESTCTNIISDKFKKCWGCNTHSDNKCEICGEMAYRDTTRCTPCYKANLPKCNECGAVTQLDKPLCKECFEVTKKDVSCDGIYRERGQDKRCSNSIRVPPSFKKDKDRKIFCDDCRN